MTEKTRIDKIIEFINKNYDKDIQIFYTRNIFGDPMMCVYNEDNVVIDECCDYYYLEIFGLTDEEEKILQNKFQ